MNAYLLPNSPEALIPKLSNGQIPARRVWLMLAFIFLLAAKGLPLSM
jgi:hypothetical protein